MNRTTLNRRHLPKCKRTSRAARRLAFESLEDRCLLSGGTGDSQVSLSSAFNRAGIVADGTKFSGGGFDSDGNAISSNLLGTTLTVGGTPFDFGPAGGSDVVSAAGQTIALPTGNDLTLELLATSVNGSQANQTFTVTYTDGTTATFTQSVSDWFTPQNYSGESKAVTMAYRDLSNETKDNRTFFVYGYTFALNSAKTVSSLTLPNDANVEVLAATLIPATAQFEFGTETSPVDPGFTKVDASTTYSASLGYGWTTGGIQERDRGVGSDMDRAFNFVTSPKTFQVNLPQGVYNISLTSGDADYAQGPEGIFINGTQVDTISTQVNQFVTHTYQVTIASSGLSLQLEPLPGGTGNALINGLVINPVVVSAPTVASETPANSATNVATSTTATASFNEAVQASTISFTLTPKGGSPVSATVAYNSSNFTATLTPSAALANNTTYTATVSGAKDSAGEPMSGPFSWSFTTNPAAPPKVTSETPASSATKVATSTTATATFNEAVQASTISFTLTPSGGSPIAANVTYNSSNDTATLTPSAALATSTKYTAAVSGAKDSAGDPMSGPFSWSFTTDPPAPTVTSETPAISATNVDVSTTATATFSEAVQASTISFTLTNSSGGSVAGSVSYNSSANTTTFTPNAALASGTSYTATVSGAENNDGDPMSGPFSWSFTTSGSPPSQSNVFYISPNSTSGTGTYSNPFGVSQLLNTTTSPVSQGPALTVLQPGDTLYFLGGNYHVSGSTNPADYSDQLISPPTSGTVTQPITIAAYPGQTVTMYEDQGSQSLFGTDFNYVRYLGFTVEPTPVFTSEGINEAAKPFDIDGSNDEVGYNDIIGAYVATVDNHEGIQVEDGNNDWIHNNYIHGFTGESGNSDGIKVYYVSNSIFEDNYITDNTAGVVDKGWNATPTFTYNGNTWRRNWVVDNADDQFVGNNQGTDAQYFIYDNVFEGNQPMQLNSLQVGDQIYNNLLIDPSSDGQFLIGNNVLMMSDTNGGKGYVYETQFWNNVMLQEGTAGIEAYHSYDNYVQSGSTAPFAYSNYNVFDGAPGWDFANETFNLSQWQAQGFDTNSMVISSDSTLYPNIASGDYTLATAYQTAGRNGEPVGPLYSVNQIMNPSRYGPANFSPSSGPQIRTQPSNQSAAAGGTATFTVAATGSGLFYQWEQSNDGGNTWIPIQGANSASYTTPALSSSNNGEVFRCLLSNADDSAWSGTATLKVTATSTPAVIATTITPSSNQTMTTMATPTFAGVGSGTAPTVAPISEVATVQTDNVATDPSPAGSSGHASHAVRAKTSPSQSNPSRKVPPITIASVHPRRTPVQSSKELTPHTWSEGTD
jgi:methionine-rich copper-binding protein CopC